MDQDSINQANFFKGIIKKLRGLSEEQVQCNHKRRQGVLAVVSRTGSDNHERIIMKISSDKSDTFVDIAYSDPDGDEPPGQLEVFDKISPSNSTLKYCREDSDHTYRARNLLERKGDIQKNLVKTINDMFEI